MFTIIRVDYDAPHSALSSFMLWCFRFFHSVHKPCW
jgi:transposase